MKVKSYGGEWSTSRPLAAFWLRNINGTNSIGGSVGPRAGLGISEKRKICLLCWDLNIVQPSPLSRASTSQFHLQMVLPTYLDLKIYTKFLCTEFKGK